MHCTLLQVDLAAEKLADRDIKGDTRKQGLGQVRTYKAVVDVRDFRSSLPSMLYSAGFTIIPRTLVVMFTRHNYDIYTECYTVLNVIMHTHY